MTVLTESPRGITGDEFRDISELLQARTGIRLVPGKEALVMGRLDRRLRQLGLTSYREYLQRLRLPVHQEELRHAIDLLTTNETYFFREKQHFDFLFRLAQSAARRDRMFRVWSAASSSGEEAYSAAMVLAEVLRTGPWEVVGTDISSRVVLRAQRGLYPIAAAERIPGPFLRKYCRKGRDEYDGLLGIARELRERVTFHCANLMEDLNRQLGSFDVILLRNVMIYFDGPTRADLVGRMQEMLRPGGYLVVGHSETLAGVAPWLRQVQPSVYQLRGDDDVVPAR